MKKLILAITILLLSISMVVGSVFAQDLTEDPTQETIVEPTPVPSTNEIDLDTLASALGITPEELQARISMGAKLSALYEEAGIDIPYFQVSHAALAAALGITMEELQARLDAGETLADLHIEAGFSLFTFEIQNNLGKPNLANALGITLDELDKRLADGEKMLDLRMEAGFHPEQSNAGGLNAVAKAMGLTPDQLQNKMAQYFEDLYEETDMQEPSLKTNNGNGQSEEKDKSNNGNGNSNEKEKTNNAGGKKK